MRYDFNLFDLAIDKIIVQHEYSITFHEDSIEYCMDCITERKPNEEEGEYMTYSDVVNYQRTRIKRSAITAIDMCDKKNKDNIVIYWQVSISVIGASDDVFVRFESRDESAEFYRKCADYVFSNKTMTELYFLWLR